MRSEITILRKREQARVARGIGVSKRRESEQKKAEAQQKQLEEERYDIKSTKAQKHSNKLRHEREKSLNEIERCQTQIDIYTTNTTECEKRIDSSREQIKSKIKGGNVSTLNERQKKGRKL